MATRQIVVRIAGVVLMASALIGGGRLGTGSRTSADSERPFNCGNATLIGPATAAENVPFKARSGGIITNLGFDPVRNIVYLHVTGKGEATHLGTFTVDGNIEISLTPGVPGRSTWVYTAANGDMLLLAGMGGHATGPTTAASTLRIVGGTGRFQGATGLLQVATTFAIAPPTSEPNPYSNMIEGTISFKQQEVPG
jgi:hypothetical protein